MGPFKISLRQDFMSLTLGIDIGSTTAKVALMDNDEIIFQSYERHYSKVREKSIEIVQKITDIVGDRELKVAISGSAGFGIYKAGYELRGGGR